MRAQLGKSFAAQPARQKLRSKHAQLFVGRQRRVDAVKIRRLQFRIAQTHSVLQIKQKRFTLKLQLYAPAQKLNLCVVIVVSGIQRQNYRQRPLFSGAVRQRLF